MGGSVKVNQQTVLWGLAGAAGAYFLGKYIIKDATGEVAQTMDRNLNPTKDTNLAYRGVNSIGAALTGDGEFRLGGWLYDILHPAQAEQIAKSGYVIVDKQPPEASTLPNSWNRDTPGPSGRASVTKEQFNDMRTM